MTVQRKIGIFFWTLAGICLWAAAHGLFYGDLGWVLAWGLTGAWFALCASLPREWFIKGGS